MAAVWARARRWLSRLWALAAKAQRCLWMDGFGLFVCLSQGWMDGW